MGVPRLSGRPLPRHELLPSVRVQRRVQRTDWLATSLSSRGSMYSGMEWNGGRQLLMDDDILDGQQPGKREEGAELGGQSSQKRREEEGRGQLRLLLCQAAPSFKVRRSSWRFLQGFSRGRPDRVRRPPSCRGRIPPSRPVDCRRADNAGVDQPAHPLRVRTGYSQPPAATDRPTAHHA